MKKLMILTHDLAIGGLQQVVVNICKYIDRKQFDVSVLCLNSFGEFTADIQKLDIPVSCLPKKANKPDYLSFIKVAKIFKEEKIQIVHTHNTQAFIDGVIAGKMTGVERIVHTDHARAFPDKRRYMFVEWLLSHFTDNIVGVSNHTGENLIKFEKISPQKIVIIPNGVDAEKLSKKIDIEQKRKELLIAKRYPIIGLGVRLTEQKGITYLLNAMPAIIKKYPNITLLIAGDGPLGDELKREAQNLGLISEKYVRFIGARTDMHEIIKILDLYILPSLWEGLPMVILEALAVGCPVVATDVGGVMDAINDGVTGYLVTPGDHKQLENKIIKVLDDEAIREKFRLNGRKLFMEYFSAELMVKRYEKLYLGVQ